MASKCGCSKHNEFAAEKRFSIYKLKRKKFTQDVISVLSNIYVHSLCLFGYHHLFWQQLGVRFDVKMMISVITNFILIVAHSADFFYKIVPNYLHQCGYTPPVDVTKQSVFALFRHYEKIYCGYRDSFVMERLQFVQIEMEKDIVSHNIAFHEKTLRFGTCYWAHALKQRPIHFLHLTDMQKKYIW